MDIVLSTPDGPMHAYTARPDGPPRGGLVVIQEAFGVNAHIADVTRRAAAAGFDAVAPELFHRGGAGLTADYGDFERVIECFGSVPGDAAVLTDIDAALDHLRAAGHADERIGVVGFCFGGRASFLTARHRALGAAIGFYGGGIVRARFPQFPPLVDGAAELRTPWLGLFGDRDGSIPPDEVEELRTALTAAPVTTEIVRYPEAGHGFHCDVRDDYREADARDAWARTLAFLDEHLA